MAKDKDESASTITNDLLFLLVAEFKQLNATLVKIHETEEKTMAKVADLVAALDQNDADLVTLNATIQQAITDGIGGGSGITEADLDPVLGRIEGQGTEINAANAALSGAEPPPPPPPPAAPAGAVGNAGTAAASAVKPSPFKR